MIRKEAKNIIIHFGLIIAGCLLFYRFPHQHYTLLQYLIKPARNSNSVFTCLNIVPLVFLLLGSIGLAAIKPFANKNRFLVLLLVFFLLPRGVIWSFDLAKTVYYWVGQDRLSAVDIKDSQFTLQSSNEIVTLHFNIKFIDYGRKTNTFTYRIYLPDGYAKYLKNTVYESNSYITTTGNWSVTQYQQDIPAELKDGITIDDLIDADWNREEIIYELYNKEEEVKIIGH
ncbi:MAG TPA: hypothetical protein VN258_14040 [Mobilitalea sp.]|nr:hypothetical protein [Mobilitalea sp.]